MSEDQKWISLKSLTEDAELRGLLEPLHRRRIGHRASRGRVSPAKVGTTRREQGAGMAREICKGCDSVYNVRSIKIGGHRDVDSIMCDVCGTELKKWDGGIMYMADLVERHEPPNSPTV